jgi:hypothetical protein
MSVLLCGFLLDLLQDPDDYAEGSVRCSWNKGHLVALFNRQPENNAKRTMQETR